MFKLMKYEFRKTWMTKLILLAAAGIAEIIFLAGLYGGKDNLLSAGILLLVFLATVGITVIGLESIMILHRDMNTKQSYMLFMTPNSCYSILGAKTLENGFSILAAGLFFFLLGMLDITLLLAKMGELNELWVMMRDILNMLEAEIPVDAKSIAAFFFSLLTGWISVVATAFLADVISAALLYGKRFNGVVSFGLFLLLSWFSGWVAQKLTENIGNILQALVIQGCISLAFAVVMYFATARIMERKLSV